MAPPNTYAQWMALLDCFMQGAMDDALIGAARGGSLSWTQGYGDRFARALAGALNKRIDTARDCFTKQISRGASVNLVSSLISLRKEYTYTLRFALAVPVPTAYRDDFKRLVMDEAEKTQKALEESAKHDRTGRQSSVIRNHRVDHLCL